MTHAARSESTLRLLSPPILLTYTGSDAPGSSTVEGWRLCEVYGPPGTNEEHQRFGSYQIAIEREVNRADQISTIHNEAIQLATRIRRVWPYVVGIPFERPPTGTRIELVAPPKGWISNFDGVQRDLAVGRYDGGNHSVNLRIGQPRHRLESTRWPLTRLVAALTREANLPPIVNELIDVHELANTSASGRAYSTLLSVSLEIARELVPGNTYAEKSRLLGQELGGAVTESLARLWVRANSHRQTRHAVVKNRGGALHPSMTPDEHAAFARNVDAVIRHVVCVNLGIATVTLIKP